MSNQVIPFSGEAELCNHLCSCVDPETDEPTEGDPCYGTCWDLEMEMFTEDTRELLASNDSGWWRVDGIRLWNRTVGGYFHADNAEDLLRGITVDAMWTLRYAVHDDFTLHFCLSHHDGAGAGTLRAATPDEREGLEE